MQGVQTPPPRAKRGVLRALLLIGMGLMIPCYLFTVGNVALSPWPLYERNRLALAILTPLCLALLLLLRRAAKAACFERHERAMLLGFAAFYFAAQMLSAFALRFTPMTDLEQCVSAARRLLDANQPGLSERSLIYLGRNPHNMGVIYLFCAIFRAADLLGADQLLCAALVCSLLFTAGLLCAARLCRRLGGAQAQARALLLFATCLPFLYCTSELYTDVFSLAFSPMILLAYFKARDAESLRARAGYALLFALSAFFGAQLRFTTVIAAIACLIAALFEKRVKLTAILAVPLALCFALGGAAIQAENEKHLGAENIRNNKLPVLHFVLMGLPVQSDEGYGQYGDGGWLIFTTSFDSPQARDAALRQKFIDRAYTLAHHPDAAQLPEPEKPLHLRPGHVRAERNLRGRRARAEQRPQADRIRSGALEPGVHASGDGAVSGADAAGLHGLRAGGAQARHERRAAVSDAAGRVSVPVHLGNAGALFLPVYDGSALRRRDI